MPGRTVRAGLVAAGVMSLGACDVTNPEVMDPGHAGELARGVFFYECDHDPDDAFCDGEPGYGEFPEAVAVGASFEVDYEPNRSAYVDLVSGCLDCMERTDDGFVIPRAGRAPLLAENSRGEIYDVLHIEAKEPARLLVRVDGDAWPDGELVLVEGTLHRMTVTPQAADGTELGGALDYTWEVGDAAVLAWTSSDVRNDVDLRASASGQTTVTVRTGALSFELLVRVKEAF